jgi:hypothetical protein
MWDPDTYDFHESRDVIWLRRMFFTKKVAESPDDIVVVLEPPTYLDGASDSEDDDDAEARAYDATDLALDAPAFAAAAADNRGLFDSSDDEAGESVRSFVNRQYQDWGQGHESDFNGSDKPSENGSDDEDEGSVEPSGNGASVIEEETESEAEETKEEDRGVVTRSGRVSKPPARFRETGLFMSRSDDLMKNLREVQELSMMNIDIPKGDELTRAEEAFFDGILELRDVSLDNVRKSQIHDPTEVGGVTPLEAAFVGMGIGGGFGTTQELHVLDYKQAVLSRDRREWEEAIDEEHQRMMQHNVFVAVPKSSVPPGNRVIDTTWAMKLKANGVRRARLAARGFKQTPGVNYDPDTRSSPVVCDASIKLFFVLATMAGYPIHVVDVQGAFLNGEFENGEKIYMKVPDGFERYYDPETQVLLLLRTLYGLIQAAIQFWRKLVLAFAKMGFKRSKADPCVFYKMTPKGLLMWVVVVDDCAGCGPLEELLESKNMLMEIFACEDQGPMREYVGNKVEYLPGLYMKILQPVLIQSLRDEFDVYLNLEHQITTPAVPRSVMRKGELDTNHSQQFYFRSGVGKLLHLQKWSRPDIINATRELAHHMGTLNSLHIKALEHSMSYVVQTPE